MIQECQTLRTPYMLKPTHRVDQSVEKDARELTLRSLFELEESNLLRYAFSLVRRRAVAEEIVQEVFLQLHIRWDDVDAPREWLFRSVRNRAYNYMRDNRRVTLNIDDEQMQSDNDEEESPEEMLLRLEAIGELRQMVEQLGEDDQRLVKLKYFENLKYRDISEKTGLSISNVGYRLHHILKGLANKLRPLGIDESS